MKFKYAVKRFFNSNSKLLIVILVAVVAAIISISYALFTGTVESKGSLNIVTGNLYSKLESSELDNDNEIVLAPNEIKLVNLKVTNINSVNAKYNLYYKANKENPNIEIGYLDSSEVVPANTGFVVNKDDAKNVRVMIKNNDTENITVTFGSNVGLSNATLAFPQDKLSLNPINNKAIVKAYTYNEDSTAANYCINGEEATCQETNCIETKTANSCLQGTVIKYKVNNSEEKIFYVLHDDGANMTLQQRENTVRNIPWVSKEDYVAAGGTETDYGTNGKNDKGPITILNALESATSTWNHVNMLEYTPGETNLYQNAFTGCTFNGGEATLENYQLQCNTNSYTMSTRTARARMITALEASSTGCLVYKDGEQYTNIMGNSINASNNGSCPDWMHNYLYNSSIYGGSYLDNTTDVLGNYNYGYWTMGAYSSSTTPAWTIRTYGRPDGFGVSDITNGARAVVEISK